MALRCLPGVGPKSAQRMALHLLERSQSNARVLADSIGLALDKVGRCETCRMLSETSLCPICADTKRDASILCIVEGPADVFALEQTSHFRGKYFVLSGHLSPLDGIGPNDIGIPELRIHCEKSPIQEVILATNPTVEGEATAQYIANVLSQSKLTISRIANGVPMGSKLEYLDGNTLTESFSSRKKVQFD